MKGSASKCSTTSNNPSSFHQLRRRYGVSDMSLWRWQKDQSLGFPKPLRINGRRFWKLSELEAWEVSRMKGANNAAG
jgi:predicted DNA-binding transcriptional regulator AlpA